ISNETYRGRASCWPRAMPAPRRAAASAPSRAGPARRRCCLGCIPVLHLREALFADLDRLLPGEVLGPALFLDPRLDAVARRQAKAGAGERLGVQPVRQDGGALPGLRLLPFLGQGPGHVHVLVAADPDGVAGEG